ncbi:MAG: DEAD/DEAH box helicase [Candidatus Eisenbacteria bacterium]|uniref:DEAD/DEAH box helicase n=1 Tax=Eiseniibacteriota bacterium TaxID=2212470 RepID=A0A956NER4_UNCEI|nr:DEAD/DEAH box helicase [Candidatus Eisenbacteria bacterium]MCB9463533.1 DEAD/DEAH box helicase [Candidatus Eisenbacteria bacterium]
MSSSLEFAHPAVRRWFERTFDSPTTAQDRAWPEIASGKSTLLLAPTGSGKTLAAFLFALNQLMVSPEPPQRTRCRVLYISPLKALGVDVERNLRAPIAGIRAEAERAGETIRELEVGIRTGDTPQSDRARMVRRPPDILITTPESLYLLLTSQARETLRSVETVIVDEIHSLVATKRGAHLFLSLERLEALRNGSAREDAPTPATGMSEGAKLPARSGAPLARSAPAPLQRIGLSATQRPLDEVARLLGGGVVGEGEDGRFEPRPVEIVDAGRKRALELVVEVPVEDMTRLGDPSDEVPSGPASQRPPVKSIWPSIHPRLVELIRAHRSTMVFVNSRRLAERLAGALNDEAEEEIALAHHGSLSKEKRMRVEDLLKRGELPAIVATSSLELGIDMGAVDLVIQIEAPPSVASGIQRVGRAGHHVGAVSRGVVFPKHRGDLLASAAVVPKMRDGEVEATHYPRNPLDVLAQQIVAEAAVKRCNVEELFRLLRGAAPFADLPRSAFDGVLDMLSGRYPSDEFAELRPRITWDRVSGTIEARQGARRVAVVNGGTIPDRGLFGVFLADGDGSGSRRVGELDEEMVFESRPGEVFVLGASSWRIENIDHNRVTVLPAPGEPGRMPFWKGDRIGRAPEFGRAIGSLAREIGRAEEPQAIERLRKHHGLEESAARNLVAYVRDQYEATGVVPSEETIVVERFVDEVGDWRVCILSPYGSRVHAPWSTAILSRLADEQGLEVDMMYSDDGMVFRLPESESAPDPAIFFPRADEVESLVVRKLSDTSLFASHFRENAGRALLLPKRNPTTRAPLWAQRKRSADLLKVAARFERFPIILETYRECLRDVFDLPSLTELLRDVAARRIRVATVDTHVPSPFASSLLFTYVGNFVYDSDAPLAERRAQILSLDHAQLRELLGEAELRALLDGEVIWDTEKRLRRLGDDQRIRHADDLHDTLLSIGDLTKEELEVRAVSVGGELPTDEKPVTGGELLADEKPVNGGELLADEKSASAGDLAAPSPTSEWIDALVGARRIALVPIGGEKRYVAAEDLGRLRDALGVVPPPGMPEAFLESVADPLGDLVSRFARTHGPFRAEDVAARFGLGIAAVTGVLHRLRESGRIVEGEFLPGGRGTEWCDASVLRRLKQQSLARLRAEIEPVDPTALGRFLPEWHGLARPLRGFDGLLRVIEQLQGCPLPASDLETEILPARIEDYQPSMLDELCYAGELMWRGIEPIGTHDGRIVLYLTEHYPFLGPVGELGSTAGVVSSSPGAPKHADHGDSAETSRHQESMQSIREYLTSRGAVFFAQMAKDLGGFPQDLADALWLLVWEGVVTNDTLAPLRSFLRQTQGERSSRRNRRDPRARGYRPRTVGPSGTEGRWSLLPRREESDPTETERRTALAEQLLQRHGVLLRESTQAEGLVGGFSLVYPVLKAMEESGRVRRGYFVAGLGATQFALPGADDRLRALREAGASTEPSPYVLAATDPANPYGAALRWPETTGARPGRVAGAQVVLHEGRLLAYIGRTERSLLTFLPEVEPERSAAARVLAATLSGLPAKGRNRALTVTKIDGEDPAKSFLAQFLEEEGFRSTYKGLYRRKGSLDA